MECLAHVLCAITKSKRAINLNATGEEHCGAKTESNVKPQGYYLYYSGYLIFSPFAKLDCMEKTIQVIEMAQNAGLFSSYAIGGGIAALFYIEPVATFDLDIFIILPESSGPLISLTPIYSWFSDRGYKPSQEQIVIEGIAVQFIPVYNDLVKDGILDAAEKKYGNTLTRVLKPEYLIALMLQTCRSKDKERLSKFLQETAIDYPLLDSILLKYNLKTVFETFKEQYYGR
jgi:hypothetical protein